jgi:hypothetical protein
MPGGRESELSRMLPLPPKSSRWKNALWTIWWAFGALWLIFIFLDVLWFGPAAVWYAAVYGASVSNVMVVSRPSDCNFLRAPIGDKGCHYERTVESWKDAGEPRRVLLGWTKVSD